MRRVGVVTVGRSDYGLYRPVLRALDECPDLEYALLVTGTHLSAQHGRTMSEIEDDGFRVAGSFEMLFDSDRPEAFAKSAGFGVMKFAERFAVLDLDVLLLLGDRLEMLSAAMAALPFTIPVAHIHGGEITEGAIDNAIRHAITKLSHLHFVATPEFRDRVIRMGEEPWRVIVSGAPGLDNVAQMELLPRERLEERYEINLEPPVLLVTYHPVTLELEGTAYQVDELIAALEEVPGNVVFTAPNADPNWELISRRFQALCQGSARYHWVPSFGARAYWSLMSHADVMVGNSSGGIVEAPSFCLPVVNIGSRQTGRPRSRNVVDSGYARSEIVAALRRALSAEFRQSLQGMANPYGDGRAAGRIVAALLEQRDRDRLLRKHFHEPLADPIDHPMR